VASEREPIMLRVSGRSEVIYGHYNDLIENYEELNRMCAERGLKQWYVLSPLMGKMNIVVTTCDYDSYAEMKQEQERFQSDSDCMKVFRAAAQWEVQGSVVTEILESTNQVA
jgi:hypothetical protein